MTSLHTIKIRGFHCDLYGHVNNARYLEFLEEARWEFVATGPELADLEKRGLGFIVAAISIEYRRPVGLGEVVEVRSTMEGFDPKRAHMRQQIFHQASGKLVADARVSFAIIDLATKRAVTLSEELRRWLDPARSDGDRG